jgi:Tfp pilus assembly PilM family ATPase
MARMVALEISPKVIRAVEYQPGDRPLRIFRAAVTERPGGEPAAVGQFLRDFLDRNGFTAKTAVVCYLGPVIEHRIYSIPPVTGSTREELLRGKIAQDSATAVAELRVTGEVVGTVMEGGYERHEVMTLYTPEFEIRRLVFLLVEAGLTPVQVVSVPVALAGLHPADAADELCGFLHLEPSRCVIAVSGAGKLRFAREFPLKAPDVAAAPDLPAYGNIELEGGGPPKAHASEDAIYAERLVLELTRSLLYFRQISRGGSITRLYWSGDPPVEEARRLIAERLKLDPGKHPAGTVATFEQGVPGDPAMFGVPIGLAAAEWGSERVNLLPVKYLQRKERRGSVIALVVILAVFLTADLGLYLGLRNAEKRYREVLEGAATVTRNVALSPEELARWMTLKSALGQAAQGEKAYAQTFTRWRALLATLGAPVPPEMRFLSATFLPADPGNGGEGGGRAEVRVIVHDRTPAAVQKTVNAFLEAVRAQPVVSDPHYSVLEIRPRGSEAGGGYEQEFLLGFTMREG